jgi:hypothetical protein
VITSREKELVAQQADVQGWIETALSLRCYLRTGAVTAADIVRMQVLARNFGWDRLPGWRIVRPSLTLDGRRLVLEGRRL